MAGCGGLGTVTGTGTTVKRYPRIRRASKKEISVDVPVAAPSSFFGSSFVTSFQQIEPFNVLADPVNWMIAPSREENVSSFSFASFKSRFDWAASSSKSTILKSNGSRSLSDCDTSSTFTLKVSNSRLFCSTKASMRFFNMFTENWIEVLMDCKSTLRDIASPQLIFDWRLSLTAFRMSLKTFGEMGKVRWFLSRHWSLATCWQLRHQSSSRGFVESSLLF